MHVILHAKQIQFYIKHGVKKNETLSVIRQTKHHKEFRSFNQIIDYTKTWKNFKVNSLLTKWSRKVEYQSSIFYYVISVDRVAGSN
jgi:hypothetical protein